VSGPKTSSIKRPPGSSGRTLTAGTRTTTVGKPAGGRRASDAGRSRLGDLTRPIAIDRRITRRRRSTILLGLVALGIAGAFAAALFVLPVQTWFEQDDELARRSEQLQQLETVNADLQAEVDRLRTDDGVREAAREEIGYLGAGESRQTVLDVPDLPTVLPEGWPYGVVSDIMALRAGTTP
jgi:cell division protein FtsB